MKKGLRWMVIGGLAAALACSNGNPVGPSFNDHSPVPWGDEDAELMALCLSGELTAPEGLYADISRDLQKIREDLGASYPIVTQLKFRPPWLPSCVIAGINPTLAASIRDGSFHTWDELNQRYHLTRIDVTDYLAVLYFEGRLNSRRLAELYQAVTPGLHPEPNGLIGDGPNIYPRVSGNVRTYLYRNAWGDCMSGCIYSEYWYFLCSDSKSPVLIGHWTSGSGGMIWYFDSRLNIEVYKGF